MQGASSLVHNFRADTIWQCPELETNLYNLFLERREKGQSVCQGWFRAHADCIFHEMYPNVPTAVFQFLNGWFQRFLQCHQVSI